MTMKLDLSESNEAAIFEQYPIIKTIGRPFFEVKFWILLKGMQSQTGQSISVASLGHNPCHAMMDSGINYETIDLQLKFLAGQKLIEISDPRLTKAQRQFLVSGKTAYEIHQLLNDFDLIKLIGSADNCRDIFKKFNLSKTNNYTLTWLQSHGKNVWFGLNNENGLFTSKLLKIVLWNTLPEYLRQASESFF